MREEMPNAHIVLLGLLPRDARMNTGAYEWPNHMSRAIALANYDYKVRCANAPLLCNHVGIDSPCLMCSQLTCTDSRMIMTIITMHV